jgi:hypothetical protein
VRLDDTGQVQANLDLARAEGAGGSVGKGKVLPPRLIMN